MNKIHLFFISAGLTLLCATGAQASEYDVLAPLRVEGTYAVFQGTAEVLGNAFNVGGSTFSAKYGKIGIGTSTPSYLLHVSSAAGVAGDLLVISTGVSNVIRMTGAGEIYANKFYGDGSGLTNLTVAGDNLGNHTATTTVNMASWGLVNVSSVNFLSNVFLTSATTTNYGGVYASTHVYTPGNIYAAKFYGDGSGLGGISGDNLGNHIATAALNMAGFSIVNASSINYMSNVYITSGTAAQLGGLYISSNVYIVGVASATKYYGDGSALTGLAALSDNLGNHTATQDLKMQGLSIVNAASGTFTQGITASSFTATGIGMISPQLRFNQTSANIVISSEASNTLGGGVRVSTNVYIVGFASAAYYYGNGSGLTGISGDNLGNHIATTTLNMATFNIVNVGSITATGAITTYSTMTVAGNAFSVGGSTLTVNEGKVGIGVAAPGKPFEVKNTGTTFKVDTAAGYVSLYVDGTEMVKLKP